jgi:hypothetical protein
MTRRAAQYPLITNGRSPSCAQVLTARKGEPRIEKRFKQRMSVHEIAPVFLKNEARIEARFLLNFLALLVQARIECELRLGDADRRHRTAAAPQGSPRLPAPDHRTHPAPIHLDANLAPQKTAQL